MTQPAEKTILVVEDDEEMLEYFKRIIEDEGFKVLTASNGLEVVEKMSKLRPDAAVLDLMLPKYGGVELVFELRRGPAGKVPLIIVTARYTGVADRAVLEQQPNVAAFFEKPVDIAQFTRRLHEILGTK